MKKDRSARRRVEAPSSQKHAVTNGRDGFLRREKAGDEALQFFGFQKFAHPFFMAAGQKQRVEISLARLVPRDRISKLRAFFHFKIRGSGGFFGY